MLSTQMEELKVEARSRHEAMSSSVDALQASGHKVKKHVVRLAKQVEVSDGVGGQQVCFALTLASRCTAKGVAAVREIRHPETFLCTRRACKPWVLQSWQRRQRLGR